MDTVSRRSLFPALLAPFAAQQPGERPPAAPPGVEVLNPRERVPVAWIIDDSTCLVNLNRFAIPQFAATFPDRYTQDWRSMPHEIPDSFVRRFADWSRREGVKGKYSIVPFPACVGRLDRELPGWTPQEVSASLDLVRRDITPHWDIHPEMITHTRILDLTAGHPIPQRGRQWMENWDWCAGRSVDEIASYIAYALRILKNVELPLEGFTTPGGFGQGALPELARAAFQALRSVYSTEIPHYFRNLHDSGSESVAPRIEWAAGLTGPDPQCVVSIYACTGDRTGNWDCSRAPEPDRFISPDLAKGRLVEVIDRGEPAAMLCHWTGIYYNGRELGFLAMQEIVRRLHARYTRIRWMKLGELARYWAARELTRIEAVPGGLRLQAPYACPDFTLRWKSAAPPVLRSAAAMVPLSEVSSWQSLEPGTWRRDGDSVILCIALPKGTMHLAA